MVRAVLTVFAAVLVGSAVPAVAIHSHHGVLMGANEIGQAGDPAAWGVAAATVDEDAIFYYLLVKGSEMPTAAHIHRGGPTENGGVVIGFEPEFIARGGGVYVAHGMVTVDEDLAAELAANPRGFYFNVHTATYPAGAARAQLIGSGRTEDAWAAYLGGNAELGTQGPAEATGYSLLTYTDGRLFYYVLSMEAEGANGAHVHGGRSWESGGILVNFSASFQQTDDEDVMVAEGDVMVAAAELDRLRSSPGSLYVNVHTPAYPAGAMRGQLLRPERRLVIPVVTNANGLNNSRWRTMGSFGSQVRNDASVLIRFYQANPAGMADATMTRTLIVPAETNVTLEDLVGDFLQSRGNGALEIVLQQPVSPFIRVINDQSQNPTVQGAFSQVIDNWEDDSPLLRQGVLYGLYNHTNKGHLPSRTNLGWFNPTSEPVMLTLNAFTAGGATIGSTTVTIPSFSQWQDQIFNIIQVPGADRDQEDFFVTYSCDSNGAAVYASVVDNGTNDGATIRAMPTQPD